MQASVPSVKQRYKLATEYGLNFFQVSGHIANRLHQGKVKADKLKADKLKAAKKTSAKEASAHKRPRPQSLNLTANDRLFNAQTGSTSRDTNILKKPRLDVVPVKTSVNSHSNFLPQVSVDKVSIPI
ncbi:5e70eca0-bc19-44f3-b75a-c0ce2a2a51c7 [Sclerotinia trifoliorum]|uniref:5e70eca0-bc19-44f3-b75a-c0ce2a2a51c7 n=1 Tax=Sclerotinia trifoliorum TaxID=28548 RepID=A0A8H2VYE2_9HELO|nr:5e70eca0-bc19-44f3-b75a-c0ce2a2a51c7 [Sclerotinia trifoliorum]